MCPDMPYLGIVGKGKICPTGPLPQDARCGHKRGMLANRISHYRKLRNLSQTDLAEKVGTTLNMLGKLERGERSLDTDWLDKLGTALKIEPYLIIAPEETAVVVEDNPNNIELQEWDVDYGMGGGTYLDLPVTGRTHTFSRDWLRNFTHAPPEKCFIAHGAGDSMTPTILDTDMVIIDTSQREVRVGDKIWAVVYGTTGYIKRIRPMPDGSVKMLSDNPTVPPETAYDGELSVVGRVVAVVRKT